MLPSSSLVYDSGSIVVGYNHFGSPCCLHPHGEIKQHYKHHDPENLDLKNVTCRIPTISAIVKSLCRIGKHLRVDYVNSLEESVFRLKVKRSSGQGIQSLLFS